MALLTTGLEKLVHFSLYPPTPYAHPDFEASDDYPSDPSPSVDLQRFDGDIVLTLFKDSRIGFAGASPMGVKIQSSDDDGVSDPFTDIPGLTFSDLVAGIESSQTLVFDQGRSKRFLRGFLVPEDETCIHVLCLNGFGATKYGSPTDVFISID